MSHAAEAPAAQLTLVVDGAEVKVAAHITVSAALLNAGVHGFRHSLSGESRGPLCGMGICHECRATIDGTPHRRTCLVSVADGMRIDTDGAST